MIIQNYELQEMQIKILMLVIKWGYFSLIIGHSDDVGLSVWFCCYWICLLLLGVFCVYAFDRIICWDSVNIAESSFWLVYWTGKVLLCQTTKHMNIFCFQFPWFWNVVQNLLKAMVLWMVSIVCLVLHQISRSSGNICYCCLVWLYCFALNFWIWK